MVAAIAFVAAATATDFFPVEPGSRWQYAERDQAAGGRLVFEDVALEPVEIDGRIAYPIQTLFSGSNAGVTYHFIDDRGVWVAGFDRQPTDNDPSTIERLDSPIPILRSGEEEQTWRHSGITSFVGDEATVVIEGRSRMVGSREVEGRERRVLEVVLISRYGGDSMVIEQRSYYAEGVGLIEMFERRDSGMRDRRTTNERTRELISYLPART